MNFNIKKYINNFKENNKNISKEKIVISIINNILKTKEPLKFNINKGIFSFIEVSSVLRTKIKLKKGEIIKELKKHNIYVRDII